MRNERNAGRKQVLQEPQLREAEKRHLSGESLASLAREYGVTRQALSKRLARQRENKEIEIICLRDDICVTKIYVNCYQQTLRIMNYAERLSDRVFGVSQHPDWQDLMQVLSEQYRKGAGGGTHAEAHDTGQLQGASEREYVCLDYPGQMFSLHEIGNGADYRFVCDKDLTFSFERKDLIAWRTDTDGFQMKALTADRRMFVKSQAVISGLRMDDWAVEVIASDLCRQLGIPCVQQQPCMFLYAGHRYRGVCSANFELDGDIFLSFERLLERHGLSTREEDFIHLDSLSKLYWCAERLSDISKLPEEDTLKYVLDLAVLDCLTGNVDRHTRNFGLFYHAVESKYRIPLIFDNGMGLFEHDPYRDQYQSFEEAMRSVYVAPYGEDPFELLELLDHEFDLARRYPGLRQLHYPDLLRKPFVLEYERRMIERWQR